ncbi:S26 family signal peptidase [Roseateles sp. P5_E11]
MPRFVEALQGNKYAVLGHHRDNSNDSRMWGFLPADHIAGKVVFVGS